MITLLVFGLGLYLGLHFNVLVLAPICVTGAGAYIAVATASGNGLVASLLSALLPIVTAQMGYFLGLTARTPVAMLRARLNLGPSEQA
jgi:hypothetical protein